MSKYGGRRRYRKWSIRAWGDKTFRSLGKPPPHAQTLYSYLVLGPHPRVFPAAFMASRATLADDLDWSLADFDREFAVLQGKGMVAADWPAKVVYIAETFKHNAPESPNVCKAWAKAAAELPDSPLTEQALAEAVAYLTQAMSPAYVEAFREAFTKAFGEGFPKPFANQEQKQEPKQKQKQEPKPSGNLRPFAALDSSNGAGPYLAFAPNCNCRGWGVRRKPNGKLQRCSCGAWAARRAALDKGQRPACPPKVEA